MRYDSRRSTGSQADFEGEKQLNISQLNMIKLQIEKISNLTVSHDKPLFPTKVQKKLPH
jgi:hypothetical protein